MTLDQVAGLIDVTFEDGSEKRYSERYSHRYCRLIELLLPPYAYERAMVDNDPVNIPVGKKRFMAFEKLYNERREAP